MPSLPAATTIVTPAAWTAQTATCIASGSGVGRPWQPSGSLDGRGPFEAHVDDLDRLAARWRRRPVGREHPVEPADDRRLVAVAAALEDPHRPEPRSGRDADDAERVIARGRDARDVRAVARSVQVAPDIRAAAVIGAVDAALHVQLVAAGRSDAGIEDRDVGVDGRPSGRERPRRDAGRSARSGSRAGSDVPAGPRRPHRRGRAAPTWRGVRRAAKPDTA